MSAKAQCRVNDEITNTSVRLIGADGDNIGVVSIDDALQRAENAELDLVEVSGNSDPPVCRIMDYGKYKFEQSKKAQAARKKQKQIQVKEIKFRPGTEEGDYQVKLRNLIKFLEEGDKAKVTIRFRGREMAHRERGGDVLERLENDLQDIATIEQRPKMEGRQMSMVLAPKKK